MIHFCILRYGEIVQGRDADTLVKNIITPVARHDDVKFHILSDRPCDTGGVPVNYIDLDPEDIREHDHWTKIFFFDPEFIGAKESDQTIIVDIDMDWCKDPTPVIQYPVSKNEFVSLNRWWRDNDCDISGSFYKFNSHDFKYITPIYKKHYKYFRKYYYENGYCGLPEAGEQYFVHEMVKNNSKIVLQPPEWCMKWHDEKHWIYAGRYEEETGRDYYEDFEQGVPIWKFMSVK